MIVVNEKCTWFFAIKDWILKTYIVTLDDKAVKANRTSYSPTIAGTVDIPIRIYHSVNMFVFTALDMLTWYKDLDTIILPNRFQSCKNIADR